jgi:hypothetical protein
MASFGRRQWIDVMKEIVIPEPINPAEVCGTCRHFHRYAEGQPSGGCHAHPPTPLITGGIKHPISGQIAPRVDGFWAPTAESETCGEHAPGVIPKVRPVVATAEQVAQALAGIEVEGTA